MELSEVYQPIQEDLAKVTQQLKSISKVDFPWLSEQLGYVVRGGGKGIRPALTLLSGKFYQYNLTYLLPMAAAVELMHTATLVHDDAIDKSTVRRGQPTINKLFGEDIAVLVGDYLFAKAGEFVADTQSPRVIKLFSQTLATISAGEVNQYLSAFKLDQTFEHYLQRIFGKTASLFCLATQSGAILSGAPEESVEVLREYGRNLGIAFQIVDDVLDFVGTEETLGKPTGSDLSQGTLTLPAMLLIKRDPKDNPVKKIFETRDKRHIAQAIEMVRNSTIVDECYKIAIEYCEKGCRGLNKLPDGPARKAMLALADYIISREK